MLPARRAVIANAHPQLVFGRLLPSDPKRAAFDARIAGFRAGPGTMIIHLALDRLPDWRQAEAFTASPMCIWRPIWVLWQDLCGSRGWAAAARADTRRRPADGGRSEPRPGSHRLDQNSCFGPSPGGHATRRRWRSSISAVPPRGRVPGPAQPRATCSAGSSPANEVGPGNSRARCGSDLTSKMRLGLVILPEGICGKVEGVRRWSYRDTVEPEP